jgi:6-phosphogluconolactonase (cycloisomerase 2 family)
MAVGLAQPFAYVANENSNSITAYTVDSVTGALTELGGSPFGAGSTPISVKGTPNGKFVYVSNWGDNTISGYSVNGINGVLSPIAGSPFPTGPNPISLAVSPSGKFLYAADDNFEGTGTPGVSAFAINVVTGALTEISGSPYSAGTEPVGVILTPSGKYLYVSDSLDDTVYVFAVDADGTLTSVPGSPYAAGGSYPLWMAVSPSGRFLYVPNANSDNISVYRISSISGALTPISGSPFVGFGGQPASAAVTPSGNFLYVAETGDNVAAYSINQGTGALAPVSGSPFPGGNDPYYADVSGSGNVYTADLQGAQISGYTINSSTGTLTPMVGSPFSAGDGPASITLVNPAVKACGALDVSAEATLAPGPYVRQSKTSDLWNETLTITNGVTPISGPLSVVLTNLPSSTTTLYGTYPGLTTTYCFSASGNYVVPIDDLIPPGNNDTLLAGEVVSVPFVFQAIQNNVPVPPTHYKPKLISGTLDK